MKAVHLLLALVATMGAVSSARAADLAVLDQEQEGNAALSSVEFAVSERFQRAWLVLHFIDQEQCDRAEGACDVERAVRVQVPGLTYDPATRRVLFSDGGAAPVSCATVVRHRFLRRWESVDPTGQCVVHTVERRATVDDGFEGKEERREAVYFGVKR